MIRAEYDMAGGFIEAIESLYPDHQWLVRVLEEADEELFGSTGYLVHIYRKNEAGHLTESYLSAGTKLSYAFRGALARAAKGPDPTP